MHRAKPTLPRRVGVVIPTHNRAHYLPAALHSVLAQTHRAERILVVDDGSTDATRAVVAEFPGVEYRRVKLPRRGIGALARNAGCRELAELPYLCSIDSDDYVPPDYLEQLLATIEQEPGAAAAYPRVQRFGAEAGVLDGEYDPRELGRSNLTQTGALVRTDAFLQVGGWPEQAFEDWALWRRFRGHGWRLAGPADTTYFWRKHAESITGRLGADHRAKWARTIDQAFDFLTVAVPWSGRAWCVDRVLAAIAGQTYPLDRVSILFLDNSNDAAFGRRLRAWLAGCGAAETRYVRYDRPHPAKADAAHAGRGLADERAIHHHVAGIWNRIGALVGTDLVWCLEDDVVPPAGTLAVLVNGMHPELDGLSACYPGRAGGVRWPVVALPTAAEPGVRFLERSVGVEEVGAVGMGCVLVRRDLFDRPARSSGTPFYFDVNLWLDAQRDGARLSVNWDLLCEHLTPPATGRRPRAQ